MSAWRTIYVFVSSTFRDMQAERDILVKKVFPKLRARLEPYRLRIVEIDLRWGITEKDEKADAVVQLCLEQVDRSLPYFLGLLGARYGSVPKRISPDTRLKYSWLPPNDDAPTSITELEIIQGVLRRSLDERQALFYFRDSRPLAEISPDLRSLFVDGAPEPIEDLQVNLPDIAQRLAAAGLPADEALQKLLRGEPETPEIRTVLRPRDRLAIVKERLRAERVVQMDGYGWSFAGLRIRWNLARLALADEALHAQLREAASDGLVVPQEYESVCQEPQLRDFLRDYATIQLQGLDVFAARVELDLWERLKREPEVAAVRTAAAFGQATPQQAAAEKRKQLRLMAWMRHQFPGVLTPEMSAIPDEYLGPVLLQALQSLATGREALQMAQLWQDRCDGGDADDATLASNWDEERDSHARFGENRLQVYVPRADLEGLIQGYLADPQGRVLVVRGGPGTGKSALLADLARHATSSDPPAHGRTVVHYVGATPGSSSLLSVLRRLAVELNLISEADIDLQETNVDGLAALFSATLANLDPSREVCLIIDALDQLDPAHHAHDLHWLPARLPPNVRLIVSVATDREQVHAGTVLAALGLRPMLTLDIDEHPMSLADRLHLIQQIPSLAAKSLEPVHIQALLDNPGTSNPLYLKVALEELRGFGSFYLLQARIKEFAAADSPARLFEQVIDWLSPDFDPELVQWVLAPLALSRHGLSEAELHELVVQVFAPSTAAASTVLQDDVGALLRYLQPYLQWRGRLLDFHHRALRMAVDRKLAVDEEVIRRTHAALAEVFERVGREAQPPWHDQYARSIGEALHHRLAARDWMGALALVNDETFVFRKARSPFFRDLAAELAHGLATAPTEFAGAIAIALARCGSQFHALEAVPQLALSQLARHDEPRFLAILPRLHGHSDRWRFELLKTNVVLIGAGQHTAAELVLKHLEATWDGDEPASGHRISWFEQMATLLNAMGRNAEAEQYCLEGIEAAEKAGDVINRQILESTLISVCAAMQRHEEAVQRTFAAVEREKGGAGTPRVLPRIVYAGFASFRVLKRFDDLERLTRESLERCRRWQAAGLDFAVLVISWADVCLERQRPADGVDVLREALAMTRDAYPEENRPQLYILLIRSLLALERPQEAQAVYDAANEFPFSDRVREKWEDLVQQSGLVAEQTPEFFAENARKQADAGETFAAETWYLQGLGRFPQDERLLGDYGALLTANPDFPPPAEQLPAWIDRINLLGIQRERAGDIELGDRVYRRLVSHCRSCPGKAEAPLENYARFLHQFRRDLVQARQLFDEALQLSAQDSLLLGKIAALEASEGSWEEAISTLHRAWSLHQNRLDECGIRFPYLRALLAIGLRQDARLWLGQVKFLLQHKPEQTVLLMPATRADLRPRLTEADRSFVELLCDVLEHARPLTELEHDARWRVLEPVAMDVAW